MELCEESKEEIPPVIQRQFEVNTSRVMRNSLEDHNFGAILEEIKEQEDDHLVNIGEDRLFVR